MNRVEEKLRVAIDARLVTGSAGGVEQFIVGLAWGLSQLEDENIEYLFLTYRGMETWLTPYLSGCCRTVLIDPPQLQTTKNFLKQFPTAVRFWRLVKRFRSAKLPLSDGTVERLRVDVVHMTKQDGFVTRIPSIYHPHDLQHLHLPQYFTQAEHREREVLYRGLCKQASLVAVGSTWIKNDVIQQYGIPEHKVAVVPLAPPNQAYAEPEKEILEQTRSKYDLPAFFLFYPAQTWPHKNHIRLLQALKVLKDRGHRTSLVCSGGLNDHFAVIQQKIQEWDLQDQVSFLGFVSSSELQALYKLSRAVVVPSKFEAGSFPIWEAFLAKVPSACSAITSLPEQVGQGALLFDPDNENEMADVILRLWTDEALRSRLVEAATERVAQFSWQRTAQLFRCHYRRLAGQDLTAPEIALLHESVLM